MKQWLTGLVTALVLTFPASAQDAKTGKSGIDRYDQSKVPLEVEPTDPKAARIVLIAGVNSQKEGEHEYFAGTALLMQLLRQTPGVAPVMARDGWPKNPKIFEGARAIVLFMDGGGKQAHLTPERLAILEKQVGAGAGLVHLHACIDYPKDFVQRILPWTGGVWDKQISSRGHWVAPVKDFPSHPISRGVKPFEIDDGWLFNNRFVPGNKGLTPLVSIVPPEKLRSTADAKQYPGRPEVVGWAYERPDGGRAFAFTGGHLHSNWTNENLRRFVINGILWSAKVDVPEGGAKVDLDPTDLERNMERRPAAKKK